MHMYKSWKDLLIERSFNFRILEQYFAIVLIKMSCYWNDLDLLQAYNDLDTGGEKCKIT